MPNAPPPAFNTDPVVRAPGVYQSPVFTRESAVLIITLLNINPIINLGSNDSNAVCLCFCLFLQSVS